MSFHLVSENVPKLTGKVFSRKYISLGRVVSYWPEIIGREMAERACPVKINYRKPKKKTARPEATLEIAASSADAAVMQYQTGVILERINQIFKDRWITSIRFVHLPANRAGNKKELKRISLDHEKQAFLGSMLDEVSDPEIKERLGSLGAHVISKHLENT